MARGPDPRTLLASGATALRPRRVHTPDAVSPPSSKNNLSVVQWQLQQQQQPQPPPQQLQPSDSDGSEDGEGGGGGAVESTEPEVEAVATTTTTPATELTDVTALENSADDGCATISEKEEGWWLRDDELRDAIQSGAGEKLGFVWVRLRWMPWWPAQRLPLSAHDKVPPKVFTTKPNVVSGGQRHGSCVSSMRACASYFYLECLRW